MESVKKFQMVPASMLLDKNVISAINFHCGDDDGDEGQFGKYSDGLLWIGSVTDDDGKEVYGLHLATAEYPEEGSTTLVEFDAPVTEQSEIERLTAENLALQQRLTVQDQRVDELEGLLRQSDDFMYIMTGNDTQRDLDAKYGRLLWEDAIVELRGEIAAALNPTAEAESHDQ